MKIDSLAALPPLVRDLFKGLPADTHGAFKNESLWLESEGLRVVLSNEGDESRDPLPLEDEKPVCLIRFGVYEVHPETGELTTLDYAGGNASISVSSPEAIWWAFAADVLTEFKALRVQNIPEDEQHSAVYNLCDELCSTSLESYPDVLASLRFEQLDHQWPCPAPSVPKPRF